MKRLFLRYYLQTTAVLFGASLSALILTAIYPKDAKGYLTQFAVFFGSSIGIVVIG
jgi:hypothetical protein